MARQRFPVLQPDPAEPRRTTGLKNGSRWPAALSFFGSGFLSPAAGFGSFTATVVPAATFAGATAGVTAAVFGLSGCLFLLKGSFALPVFATGTTAALTAGTLPVGVAGLAATTGCCTAAVAPLTDIVASAGLLATTLLVVGATATFCGTTAPDLATGC